MSSPENEYKKEFNKNFSNEFYSQETSSKKKNFSKEPFIYQKTIVLIFACFSGLIMFILRYNLSVSIVAIIDDKINIETSENSNLLNNSIISQNSSDYIIKSKNKYNWDENTQGQILASYFYGYTLCQIPLGRLSEKFGAKWILGLGTFIPGILTLLTPLAIDLGIIYTIVLRFVMGSLHASVICCCYTLISCWIPDKEKGSGVVWLHIFFELGGILSLFLTGSICSNKYLGWKSSFYLLSIFAFAWFIPYCFLVYSEPSQNPRLSKFEKKLLDQSRAIENSKDDFSRKIVKVPPKLDIKKILTSGAVWALCVSKFTSNFGFYLITTKIPTYLREVFKIPVSENGFLSSLPYVGSLISRSICLKLSEYLIKKNLMSLTNLRKCFQAVSIIIPAVSLFLITVKNDDKNFAIFCIVLAMFGQGFNCAGDASMISEFAGDLSGSIVALGNTFACINGFIAPVFVGIVMETFDDIFFGWDIVFYFGTFLYLTGFVFFFIFGTSKLQPWAVTVYKEEDFNDKENNIK